MSESSYPGEGYSSYRQEGYGGEQGAGGDRPTSVQVQEKARETAQQVTGQVQEKTQEARQQARSRLRDEVDRRSTQAGEQVRPMADALRKTGEELRGQGNESQANVAEQVAQRVDRLGGYLTEANADRFLQDIEDFGRRRPWALAAGGVVLGFLASRFLKASSAERARGAGDGTWTAAARPGLEPTGGQPDVVFEPDVAPAPAPPTPAPAGPTAPEAF